MIKKKSPLTTLMIVVVLALATVAALLPFAWMVLTSFKLEAEVFTVPVTWFPSKWQWSNYQTIWIKIPLVMYIKNSLKLTICITIIQLITSSFAAYGFAKCKFNARDTLFMCYIVTIAIPFQVYMLPQYLVVQKLGLLNTHIALILLQSFTAFGVFLLRQFYMSIPDELLEAARIDGLTEYGIYARIMVPLSKPAMATLCIFTFVSSWNAYLEPMIYLNSTELKTIQLGVRTFITMYSIEYHLIMAASLVALVPVFIVYIFCQRYFVQGVATSGLKG